MKNKSKQTPEQIVNSLPPFERRVARLALKSGWRLRGGSKHVLLYPKKKGGEIVALARSGMNHSPSRGRKNLLSKLRHAGLDVSGIK